MPEKTPLTEMARIRCTPDDLVRWKAAAVGARRSLSDWLRLAADAVADTVRLDAAPIEPERTRTKKRKLSSTGKRAR